MSSTLMVQIASFFETMLRLHQATWRHILRDNNL